MKLGILASHPIQYQVPIFRVLNQEVDLTVYFAHKANPVNQAKAGFGVKFEWDIDLESGYKHIFLKNKSVMPRTDIFIGCHTPEIGRIIKETPFDVFIVMGWHLLSYWQAVFACKAKGIPVLVRGDSYVGMIQPLYKKPFKKYYAKMIVKQFDGFLSVGQKNKEYLMIYGANPEQIYYTPHCVDNEWFCLQSKKATKRVDNLKKEIGIKRDSIVMLFVGRMVKQKRPWEFIEVLWRLSKEGYDVRGIMVGTGPLHKKMKKKVEALKAPVTFVGFKNQTELPIYYNLADLFLLTSGWNETWGLVVNEAMASGTPCVVSSAAGCGVDLIIPGKTGDIYQEGDVDGLFKAIKNIIPRLNSKDIQEHLRKKMEQHSIQANVDGICEAVESCLSKKSK